jgi:hypothetical protein
MIEQHWYITELLVRTETPKQMRITYAGGKAFEVYISLTYPDISVMFGTSGIPVITQGPLIVI